MAISLAALPELVDASEDFAHRKLVAPTRTRRRSRIKIASFELLGPKKPQHAAQSAGRWHACRPDATRRVVRSQFVSCFALWLVACGGTPAATTNAGTPDLSEDVCAPGTMRQVGQSSCVPVGPSASVDGFVPDASGWGSSVVRPAAACTGAEIAVIGNPNCQPIDDCNAAFPPPDADVLVTSPAELQSAITKAQAGALIAIDSGVYGAISLPRDVRLVGRCAEKVVLQGPVTTDPSVVGVSVSAGANVALHSLSVTGFGIGLVAKHAGQIHLNAVVLSNNRGGVGVSYAGTQLILERTVVEGPAPERQIDDAIGVSAFYGASVELDEVDVRLQSRALSANSVGTEFVVKRSLVSFEQKPPFTAGLEAFTGAHASVDRSYFFTSTGRLVAVGRVLGSTPTAEQGSPGARVEITASVLEQSGVPRDQDSAIDVYDGAELSLTDVSVRHQSYAALGAAGAASKVTLTRSLIAAESTSALNRSAVLVSENATVELHQSAVVGAQQVGLFASDPGASLLLEASLVSGTRHRAFGNPMEEGGSGQAIAIANGAELHLESSTLSDNEGTGLFGASGAPLIVSGTLIDLTRATSDAPLGIGVMLVAAPLQMDSSIVRRSANTALAFDGAAGVVSASSLYENDVALRLSGGVELVHASSAPAGVVDGKAVLYATTIRNNHTDVSNAPITP